jgi:hypothetical protein
LVFSANLTLKLLNESFWGREIRYFIWQFGIKVPKKLATLWLPASVALCTYLFFEFERKRDQKAFSACATEGRAYLRVFIFFTTPRPSKFEQQNVSPVKKAIIENQKNVEQDSNL